MRTLIKPILCTLLFLIFSASTAFAQENIQIFHLKDGTTIQGKVIAQDDSTLLIETRYGTLEVRRSAVLKRASVKKSITHPFDSEEKTPSIDESYSNSMLHLRIIEVKNKLNAEQALSRLKNGVSFEKVANAISVDYVREIKICFNDLNVDFKKSLEKLEEGEHSDIINSNSTYFIIQLAKKTGKCKTKELIDNESSKQKVGNVCSVCGAPATFWCTVRQAWFCDKHAGKAYTPSGGYFYICK